MTPTPTTDTDAIHRYLLGLATEEEAETIERDYLTHEESLDAVAAGEEGLIEDYLSGRLPAGTRSRFENHYLPSPVHERRVAISRALRAKATPARARSWFAPLAAAAAILIVSLGSVWYLKIGHGSGRVVSVTLPALQVREAGETPLAELGNGTTGIELRLERGDVAAQPPFHALLRTVEGNELWRGDARPAGNERGDASPAGDEGRGSSPADNENGRRSPLIATVTIPSAGLSPGDYVVVLLSGAADGSELQRYYFRLVRR